MSSPPASDGSGDADVRHLPATAQRPLMSSGRRPASAREERSGRRERRRGSELLARILVAIPLAVLAVVVIDLGGLAWVLFLLAVAWACMFELYGLLARWRPVPLVGFLSAAGMVLPRTTATRAPSSRWP
jgi:uncharacterized protein YqhQ